MQRYFLYLSYSGKRYNGWQNQPNGLSVQEVLEKSLSAFLREDISITGAGRTDTGVHALFFVAHFDSANNGLNDHDFLYRMNRFLPEDIALQKIRRVKPDAHARFNALTRTYIYIISRSKDPFLTDLSYYFPVNLDTGKMNHAAKVLLDYNDFTSFSRLHSDVKTNFCRITCANWEEDNHKLVFTITADRFLRNMVRAIVGSLIDVGRGRITVRDFEEIINKRNRHFAGTSAPAKGLFLKDIRYPEDIFED